MRLRERFRRLPPLRGRFPAPGPCLLVFQVCVCVFVSFPRRLLWKPSLRPQPSHGAGAQDPCRGVKNTELCLQIQAGTFITWKTPVAPRSVSVLLRASAAARIPVAATFPVASLLAASVLHARPPTPTPLGLRTQCQPPSRAVFA